MRPGPLARKTPTLRRTLKIAVTCQRSWRAASFASSVATNYTAHLEPSPALHELANVVRLLDAASDRLVGALADIDGVDPAVVASLENIKAKARAIAAQVEATLPLG